jgi:hypothetical protein
MSTAMTQDGEATNQGIAGVQSLDENASHYKGFAKKIDQEHFIGVV